MCCWGTYFHPYRRSGRYALCEHCLESVWVFECLLVLGTLQKNWELGEGENEGEDEKEEKKIELRLRLHCLGINTPVRGG